MMKRWAVAVAGALALLLAGATAGSAGERAADAPSWINTAVKRLEGLKGQPAHPGADYDRDLFGKDWVDTDQDGCKTRNDILRTDLTQVVFKGNSTCIVASGALDDPYTGKVIKFVQGRKTSRAVEIDHVVALKNAWISGASRWSERRRVLYANDAVVLLAVDGPQNGKKGARDASAYLPLNPAYRCAYVATQIRIKIKYELTVTEGEHRRMEQVLADCGPNPTAPVRRS